MEHAKAPAGKRGGWLSARRRARSSEGDVGIDASAVFLRLWVGARPPAHLVLPDFTLVVLCTPEYQPDSVAWRGRVARAPLGAGDGVPTPPELGRAAKASQLVATELRRGGRALVTCDQGLNRAPLVAALAMMSVCQMPTPVIIDRMREARGPQALSNPHLVRFLESLRRSRPRPAAGRSGRSS